MKTITANQRILNILQNAVNNGFSFNEQDTLEEIRINAEDYLIENTEAIEVECEIRFGRDQQVNWSDGKGFDYQSWGEILDYGTIKSNWFNSPDTKVFHSVVLNSEGQVVKLYYLVGETEYNAPTGFTYSHKEKKHVPVEE